MSALLRLAVVGTPRSGNSWLRYLLRSAYCIPEVALHEVTDWAALPTECVLQIHWRRTPEFVGQLAEHGFRVIAPVRHPLDVLISILHFCWYDPDTGGWLLGTGGNEDSIRAAMPRSRPFIEYCTSPRTAALLAVSADWHGRPDTVGVRYEELVADPRAGLLRITDQIGPLRCASVEEVLDVCSMDHSRRGSRNNHFWKGQPGLWRTLLPEAEAAEILTAVRPVCERFGYDTTPDPTLTPSAADANWVSYCGQELKDTMQRKTLGFRTEVERLTAEVDRLRAEREQAYAERDANERELSELIIALTAQRPATPNAPPAAMRRHLGESAERIEGFFALQGLSVKLARMVQGLRNRVGRSGVARG
ncbi:MAG: hypothetical protein MUF18_18010 [Fimbriiglobus sp.]|jgi:hypothetical protein|nr:hypothetical protein [Fimbriiglobus sp.]